MRSGGRLILTPLEHASDRLDLRPDAPPGTERACKGPGERGQASQL